MTGIARVLLGAASCAALVLTAAPAMAQTLADREAIEDTLYRYARGLDRPDPDLYASAWSEDAVFDLGVTTYEGRDAMRQIAVEQLESRQQAEAEGAPRHVFHMTANPRVEFLSADHAVHHAYYFTMRRTGAGAETSINVIAIGSSTDELRKIDGEWLIVKRTVSNNP